MNLFLVIVAKKAENYSETKEKKKPTNINFDTQRVDLKLRHGVFKQNNGHVVLNKCRVGAF